MRLLVGDPYSKFGGSNDDPYDFHRHDDLAADKTCIKINERTAAASTRKARIVFRERGSKCGIRCIGFVFVFIATMNSIFQGVIIVNKRKNSESERSLDGFDTNGATSIHNDHSEHVQQPLPVSRPFPRWGASVM